jgi:PAS domain S-box-containing protein
MAIMTALRGIGSIGGRALPLAVAVSAGLAISVLTVLGAILAIETLSELPRNPVIEVALTLLFAAPLCALISALIIVRRQRDRALTLLNGTLEHIDQGLLAMGADHRTEVYNRRVLELLDLPESLMERRPSTSEIFAYQNNLGEFAGMTQDGIGALLQSMPSLTSGRYERVRPNGTVLEISSSPLPNGSLLRTYSDITERRRAIEEMNASMAFANSLVTSSPDCIQLLDLQGNIIFISDLGQEQFEILDFETVRGKPFAALFTEDQRSRVELALRRVLDGQTDRFTRMCPTQGGIQKWWDFIITPVHEIGRVPERLFVVARDISARQAHAEELRRAKEAAERASQAKSQFLATMSHEIRTPLNAILGFAALARERLDRDPETRRQIELIQKAGESLLTVINDVLDLSKIEAGKIELEVRPLNLRGLIEDCISLTRCLANQKGIALVSELAPAIPAWLIADEARLRQVLLNLLNNAVKFTIAGSVRLAVSASADGKSLKVEVSDTGIGIAPDRIDHLFHDFVQGDGSISRHYGGTGLGLSISRRLITLMGGEIGVSSEVGRGSTFHFSLPLVVADEAELAGALPAPLVARVVVPRSILLVDDLSLNQEIVSAMLASAGHRVTVVDSGLRAIAACSEVHYDLVLMDVQMPGMDGLEATRRIRDLGGRARQMPVIALTANVFSQQVDSYRDAGMNDHLGKPFNRDALLAMIDRWTNAPPRDGQNLPPVLNPASQSELSAMIGADKTRELLLRFRDDLPDRFSSTAAPALEADAHSTVSTAGLLGFARLSAAAATLEKAISTGADYEASLDAVLAARAEALGRIPELTANLGSGTPVS